MGVRTDDARLCNQIFGSALFESRQAHFQVDADSKALAVVAGADAYNGGDPRITGDLSLLLCRHVPEGARRTRGAARGEKRFRVVGRTAGSAERLRRGQLDVEAAVRGGGQTVAAAGGACGDLACKLRRMLS